MTVAMPSRIWTPTVAWIAIDARRTPAPQSEAFALMLLSASGMMLLAGARDLILVFLGIELMSIPTYVLTGIDRRSARSAEAALKYFLLGAFSTAFLLYGVALVYGATGATELGTIAQAIAAGALHRVSRLYWYTVEFGLAREDGELRIYGAGILSSFGESHYALGSPRPRRLGFDLPRVMRTQYRTDAFQENYFVIDRFEDVLRLLERGDMPRLWAELDALPDFMPEPALKAA